MRPSHSAVLAVQPIPEPCGRKAFDLLKGARFLEKMCGAWNNFEGALAGYGLLRGLVEVDHNMIRAADNQERRSLYLHKRRAGEVGPPAPGDDRTDFTRDVRRGHQRCRRACAGSKEPDGQIAQLRVLASPLNRVDNTLGEKWNVKDVGAILRLDVSQKIEQNRRQPVHGKRPGDLSVTRAETTASTAMGENDEADRRVRQHERAGKLNSSGFRADDDFRFRDSVHFLSSHE